MVQPSWFKGQNYVKHERWVELWRDCLRGNYEPNVDIRTVKTKTGEVVANVAEQLQSVVAETLKYSVKPEDIANDPEWFLELTRQLHKRRFTSTGGALKSLQYPEIARCTEREFATILAGISAGGMYCPECGTVHWPDGVAPPF
ncbi:TPA: protein rep [Escherichia coli]|nr:protein rep [Escherichia coli]